MWISQRKYSILLKAIYKDLFVNPYLSKTKGVSLLKVHFNNEKSEDDLGAWLLTDLDQ